MMIFVATGNGSMLSSRSMETSLRSEDPANAWKYGGYKQFARKYNDLVKHIGAKVELPPILDLFDIEKMPGPADTIGLQQKAYFEAVHANASMLRAFLRGISGVDVDELRALQDFTQGCLRSAIFEKPEKEREVQNALEQLLIGRGFQKGRDYDREIGRIKVSAKEVVPDFVFPMLDLATEVKLVSDTGRMKEVIDEINADILAYRKRYKNICFIVYDIGCIRDQAEFRRDLELNEGVSVLIIKH